MRTGFRHLSALPLLITALSCTARPDDPLGRAAAQGDLTEVKRFLDSGVSAGDRQSALVWAARSGQAAAVELLIKSGADPNGRSGVNGWPVLMHAIHKDQPEAVRALLANGASANARGDGDETALMMAAGYGYSDIVRVLLDHGADAHATRSNGENALDFALSGVMDIDRFTFGRCQTESVRVLRARVPNLIPKDPAKLKRCS